MRKQIKAQKKVIALRKALLKATPAQKKVLKAKLAKAEKKLKAVKALVKTITKKHDSKLAKKLNKEVALIKVLLTGAKDPERKAALKT